MVRPVKLYDRVYDLYATQDAAQGQEALRIAEALGRTNEKTLCCSSQMPDGIAAADLILPTTSLALMRWLRMFRNFCCLQMD